MFKPKASLHLTAGERVYEFICDHDAPLAEVIEVAKTILLGVEKMLEEAMKKMEGEKKAAEESSPAVEYEKEKVAEEM